ncbi:nuclear pore complex protein NUP214 isoform X1 [Ziziphus jujuba]|uniref:Nuclear pore complex protein NUP214 isoform X1 n=2 Tax=Ziziphus jujuba TaxID=326968 RepID=A0A6P6GMJ2_ZIZJJ|nr:nuclear pore complex protein NUP214 isoform X1 [Ziziphus jujuba]
MSMNSSEKTDDTKKMIEFEDEIEGEHSDTTDYFFERIGEPVPIKPHPFNFDPQNPPSQPLAVSELHGVVFIAHSSDGFCVARTKDVIGLALETKEKGNGSSIQESSIVDVPLSGNVRILALSFDNSTLAVSVANDIHFFSVDSLIDDKGRKPSYTISIDESSFVKDIQWRKRSEKSYLVLSNLGQLYHGTVDGPFKHVMDSVDAVEWSVKGSYIAVARKDILSIFSSKLKERSSMALSFKSWIGDSDGDYSVKVDSIRWVRKDSIVLGCFLMTEDGREENYLVQVIRSKDGKISDVSCKPVMISFYDLFSGVVDDILPFGSGPYLSLSYLEQCELAFTANKKNMDQHLVYLGWSLGEEKEVAVVDIQRDKWLPRIELQENDDDNLVLGLCIDKVSCYGNFKVQLGVEEQKELSPFCILLCLTLEGKLVMFHVASVNDTTVQPKVISAFSDEEGDAYAVEPVEIQLSKPFPRMEKEQLVQVSSNLQLEDLSTKEINRKGSIEFSIKTDMKPPDANESLFTMHVANQICQAESNVNKEEIDRKGSIEFPIETDMKPPDANQICQADSNVHREEVKSQVNMHSFEADGKQKVSLQKGYQERDIKQIQLSGLDGTTFEQSSTRASLLQGPNHAVKDLGKTGSQKLAGLGSSVSFTGKIPAGAGGLSNRKDLHPSVEMGKEPLGKLGLTGLQSSSESMSSRKFISSNYPDVKAPLVSTSSENAGFNVAATNFSGDLAGKRFQLKDTTGISTSLNFSDRPIQSGGGQRSSAASINIESLPSIRSSQVSSQENSQFGKSVHHMHYLSRENQRPMPHSGTLNSEPNLSKQFGNIKEMTKELDMLLQSIEEKGGFRDACTILQKSSVESLEQGIATLSKKCQMWRSIMDEQLVEVQNLLDMTVQVLARKIYVEGIVKQASDSQYWDLWYRQKLSSELDMKRRHIIKLNQDMTHRLIELERHFNGLELNKFGEVGEAHMCRRAFQSKYGPSRHVQPLHGLHNAMTSQLVAAEQLSEHLSKQMTLLKIDSPSVEKQPVKKELFEAIGIPYDASFSSPIVTKVSDVSNHNILLSSGSTAGKDQSRRKSSALKKNEQETARRRRDSLDRSWVSYEPPKATVKRLVLQESHKESATMDKKVFNPQILEGSAVRPRERTTSSTLYLSENKAGVPDAPAKRAADKPASPFIHKHPGSSQFTGLKSPPLQRNNLPSEAQLFSGTGHSIGSATSNVTAEKSSGGQNHIGKSGSDSVETKFFLHTDADASTKPSMSMMLPVQESKFLRKPSEISNSTKAVELSNSTIDSIQDRPSAKGSFPESGRKQDSPMPLMSAVPMAPSLPGKVSQFNLATSKCQPDEKLPPSTSSISFPLSTSSALPSSLSSSTGKSGTDANRCVSSFTSAAFHSPVLPSSGALSFQAPKPLVSMSSLSPATPTSESELQPAILDVDAASTTPTLQPGPSTGGFNLNLKPSASAPGSQPSFNITASPARTNAQAEQPSSAHVSIPAQLTTSGSFTGGKTEPIDVSNTQEDDMDEEAPETTNTTELILGSLGGFALGSTPNPSAPKPNPFDVSFGNTTTNVAAPPFSMNVPSGELFRPASFSFQSPQPSQPSAPTSSNPFPVGFGTGPAAQAPSPSGFGQPAQIGAGQQALGSVLGTFGQSRQLGSGGSGSGFGSPSGFGGTGSIGGFSSAAAGGAFAVAAPAGGGFASLASAGRGFAGVASGGSGGGFSGLSSAGGGFAGATSGGFATAATSGGGFSAFGAQQGTGGFSAFGSNTGGNGKPPQLFTQMRK